MTRGAERNKNGSVSVVSELKNAFESKCGNSPLISSTMSAVALEPAQFKRGQLSRKGRKIDQLLPLLVSSEADSGRRSDERTDGQQNGPADG